MGTWLLHKADNPIDNTGRQNQLNQDAVALLALIRLRRSDTIGFDQGGAIDSEYKGITPGGFVDFWLRSMRSANRVQWRSGRLARRHLHHLVNALHFHSDDLPFVGVASRTVSKFLVSEDSDYDDAVKEYLGNQLGIRVLSIAEALEMIRG